MEGAAVDDAGPDHGDKLRATVSAFPGQAFALLDGARFEDLPKLFRRERLFARSLFLDHADAEVEKAGPWLVGLGQAPDALDRVLALVGEEPAAVYWCCDAGEAVLHRHLRTLNMVQIPFWAARGRFAGPVDAGPDDSEPFEAVMFRHWDPRVLGALMPTLDGAQFARVLGPGEEIAFLAMDYGGVRRVVADPTWAPASPGLLTVRSNQVEALIDRRQDASHRRIATYLRGVLPEKASTMSNDDLLAVVRRSRSSGVRLGLDSEQGFGRWAYLMLATDGKVERVPEIHQYVANGAQHPDERLRSLIDHAAHAAANSDDLP